MQMTTTIKLYWSTGKADRDVMIDSINRHVRGALTDLVLDEGSPTVGTNILHERWVDK